MATVTDKPTTLQLLERYVSRDRERTANLGKYELRTFYEARALLTDAGIVVEPSKDEGHRETALQEVAGKCRALALVLEEARVELIGRGAIIMAHKAQDALDAVGFQP